MEIEELKEKTITELKAMVYDLLANQQELNRSLQIINNVIAAKEQEGPSPEVNTEPAEVPVKEEKAE